MYNYKIKISNMIVHFYIRRKLHIKYNAIHNFSVWLRTGSKVPIHAVFEKKTFFTFLYSGYFCIASFGGCTSVSIGHCLIPLDP